MGDEIMVNKNDISVLVLIIIAMIAPFVSYSDTAHSSQNAKISVMILPIVTTTTTVPIELCNKEKILELPIGECMSCFAVLEFGESPSMRSLNGTRVLEISACNLGGSV
jgi:hypothetical protein